ncbi:MAG: hypothetical protein JWP21_2053, partial [Tardiphaga sp.]|nr:hypothetical protein [Tardiphaga sp.]
DVAVVISLFTFLTLLFLSPLKRVGNTEAETSGDRETTQKNKQQDDDDNYNAGLDALHHRSSGTWQLADI